MVEFFKKFDFLCAEAKFTFNEKGETGYKTIFGGIMSLLSIITSIGFTIYFLFRLFNKVDSTVILSTETDHYVNITYSYKLPFMVRFSDSYSIPYLNQTSRLYNIYLRLWYGGSNNTNLEENSQQLYDQIEVSKCDINKHFGEYKKYFENDPDLESYYCPELRKYNQTIYGIYGGYKPFSYMHFYFAKCLNSTMNNTCFDENYINNKLSGTYLDVKFIGYKMHSLKKKVSEIEIKSERFLVSNSVYKRIWMYIRKIRYITDYGLILSKKEEDTFHQYENIRSDTDIRDINSGSIPGAFLTLSILNNGEVSIYNRKYQKVQDYIATIGGIIKAITIFCSLLNYFNSINSYYFYIIKEFMIENHLNKNGKIINNNIDKINNQSNKEISSSNRAINNYSPFMNRPKYKFPSIFNNKNKFGSLMNQTSRVYSDEEIRERKLYSKFCNKFLPSFFFGNNKKAKIKKKWYINHINMRMNIINVLNLFKKIDDININNSFMGNQNSQIRGNDSTLIKVIDQYESRKKPKKILTINNASKTNFNN